MGVNSIRADKLSAIAPRILNKKKSQYLILKVKSIKTAQMLFEDCVAPS